jgi:hypothetical protein
MIDVRYPLGPFLKPESSSAEDREIWIRQIESAPDELRAAVEDLDEEQLDTPYRDGGWSVRQLVHHVPDSHMNSYVRLKLALTEDEPVIKPYDEARWADLADSRVVPVEVSLALLEALHERWVRLLESMTAGEFQRAFRHPETGLWRLDQWTALYAWHGRHHVAHVAALRERMGW